MKNLLFIGFKEFFVLIVVIFFITSCGTEDDDSSDTNDQKYTVESHLSGTWVRLDTGKELYLGKRTNHTIEEIEENLLEIKDENGTDSYYVVRNGSQNTKVELKLGAIRTSSAKGAGKGYGDIAGIEIYLQNINDNDDQYTVTTDENGEAEREDLTSSEYSIVVGSTDFHDAFEMVAEIISDTDLGIVTPALKESYSFKSTIDINEQFVYADGAEHRATITVENIGTIDAVAVQYKLYTEEGSFINLLDTDSTDLEGILSTIEPGKTKEIPLYFTTRFLSDDNVDDIFRKEKINIILKTIETNEINNNVKIAEFEDYVTFDIYRRSININLSSLQAGLTGFLIFPDHSLERIVTRNNVSNLRVPFRPDESYKIMLANSSAESETTYSVAVAAECTTSEDMQVFLDTSINEPDNNEKEATVLSPGKSLTSFLFKGDLDYYVIDMSDVGINPEPVDIKYYSHTTADSSYANHMTSGNNDTVFNAGETCRLNIAIVNKGTSTAYGLKTILSTTDSYISINENYANSDANGYSIKDLVPNGIIDSDGRRPEYPINSTPEFLVSASVLTPDGHQAEFTLTAIDKYGHEFKDTFFITINKIDANLEFHSVSIYDRTVSSSDTIGNNDGVPDAGETIRANVAMRNSGTETAIGCLAEISTTDPYVTITEALNSDSIYGGIGNVEPEAIVDCNGDSKYLFRYVGDFRMSLAADTPAGHEILFQLTLTDTFGNVWNDNFRLTVPL